MTGLTSMERGRTVFKDVGNKLSSQGAPHYPVHRKLGADSMVQYLFQTVQSKLKEVESNPVKLADQIVFCVDILMQAAHRSGLPFDELWNEYFAGRSLAPALRVLSGSTAPLEQESRVGLKVELRWPSMQLRRAARIVSDQASGAVDLEVEWQEGDPVTGPVYGVAMFEVPPSPEPFLYCVPLKETK